MNPLIQQRYENLFLALAEQQAFKKNLESFPICLTLDAASVCQLKCPFCIHGMTSPHRAYTSLDWNLFQSLIDELGPYLFHVDLDNWGEPFLNKRLLDMIATLKSKSIRVRLSTNISLELSEKYLEQFVRSQPDFVIISIDGFSQETYERYRVQGDFRLALSNLETLARLKDKWKLEKPRLVWQFLVFSFNEHELPCAARHARSIGVDFRPSAPYIDLNSHADWLPSQDRYVREPYKAAKMAQQALKTQWATEPLPMEERNQRAGLIEEDSLHGNAVLGDAGQQGISLLNSSNPASDRYPCDWLYLKGCINADGSLSSCCGRYPGDPYWGELGKSTFRHLWNSGCLQEARRSLTELDHEYPAEIICARCPLPEIQQVSNSIILDALLDAPHPFRQQARACLSRFSRRTRWERQSLRLAGKVMRAIPYAYRNPIKQRLRYGLEQGWVTHAMRGLFKSAPQ
ncbi:MAG: radical SAM protein [Terriglobia bacterium]